MQDKNGRVGTPTKAVALSSLSLKWPDPDFPRLPGRAHHRSCCCKVATLAWTLGEVSGEKILPESDTSGVWAWGSHFGTCF